MKPKSSGWRPNRVGFLTEVLGVETEIEGNDRESQDVLENPVSSGNIGTEGKLVRMRR
jgi:hypothetical protein